MKRAQQGSEPSPKKQKLEISADAEKLSALFESVSGLQDKLSAVERKIEKEQAQVEVQYAKEKKTLFAERDALLEKDENFWGLIISLHPHLMTSLIPHEIELIRKHLRAIRVDDHLDDNGSYEIVFEFKDSAKEIFSPQTLRKKVVFTDDEEIDTEKTEVTESIEFTHPEEQDPRKLIAKMYKDADEDEITEDSIFNWFSKKEVDHIIMSQFGDIIRRDVYPDPEQLLFANEDEELSSEEEEEEEETNDNSRE